MKVDNHFQKLIHQLLTKEKEYKSKKIEEKIGDQIKQFESDLQRLENQINLPKIDGFKWNQIRLESISKRSKVNSMTNDLKKYLLNDQVLNIESIQSEIKDLLSKNVIKQEKVPIILFDCLIYLRN